MEVRDPGEGTVYVQVGHGGNWTRWGPRKGEKQADSCWGVLEQNFGDPFGYVAPHVLIQVELSMGLSDTQVSGLAISSRRRFNTGESVLGVKNLGEHEKVLSERFSTESQDP